MDRPIRFYEAVKGSVSTLRFGYNEMIVPEEIDDKFRHLGKYFLGKNQYRTLGWIASLIGDRRPWDGAIVYTEIESVYIVSCRYEEGKKRPVFKVHYNVPECVFEETERIFKLI